MEDSEIVDLYWRRSEQAIAETSIKYNAYCKTIAANILPDDGDVAECLNDAYLQIWNSIPPTRPNSFTAFLGRIVRNIALHRYEYNKAQKRNPTVETVLIELDDCIAGSDSAEKEYEAKQIACAINDFLSALEIENRIMFVRRYWHLESIEKVARNCNVTESTVKSSLFRTRKKLKAYLEKEGIPL